jgi:hypothetical protein
VRDRILAFMLLLWALKVIDQTGTVKLFGANFEIGDWIGVVKALVEKS